MQSIIVLALACALYSDTFDEQVFLGPYILGLAIPDGPSLGSAIASKLDCFVSGVFLPLFVTTRELRVDFTKNCSILTYVAKLAACVTACIFYRMPMYDSWALAFIMTSKGILEIAFYTFFRDMNVFSTSYLLIDCLIYFHQ